MHLHSPTFGTSWELLHKVSPFCRGAVLRLWQGLLGYSAGPPHGNRGLAEGAGQNAAGATFPNDAAAQNCSHAMFCIFM